MIEITKEITDKCYVCSRPEKGFFDSLEKHFTGKIMEEIAKENRNIDTHMNLLIKELELLLAESESYPQDIKLESLKENNELVQKFIPLASQLVKFGMDNNQTIGIIREEIQKVKNCLEKRDLAPLRKYSCVYTDRLLSCVFEEQIKPIQQTFNFPKISPFSTEKISFLTDLNGNPISQNDLGSPRKQGSRPQKNLVPMDENVHSLLDDGFKPKYYTEYLGDRYIKITIVFKICPICRGTLSKMSATI